MQAMGTSDVAGNLSGPPFAGRRPGGGRAGAASRRRASHSLEAVVGEAVALLDEAGEPALTFRALAARLGGGVASIYWYVSSRDELLDRASDHVLAGVLADIDRLDDAADPIAELRAIAVTLFDAIARRPWLGSYFMRNAGFQPNGLLLYERLGRQTLRLDLTPRQRYHAVSAVLGFVVGVAADIGHLGEGVDAEPALGPADAAAQWRALDAEAFPFLHEVADEFATHEDAEQFRAGLDLLLTGIRLQAARR
jgi:AcrR family transcriptional regulator